LSLFEIAGEYAVYATSVKVILMSRWATMWQRIPVNLLRSAVAAECWAKNWRQHQKFWCILFMLDSNGYTWMC